MTCFDACVPWDPAGPSEKSPNLIVFGAAEASGCDVEGRMWVGGNAMLSGYGVGAQLAECDEENPVLVVGGDATVVGSVKGAVWVGGEYTGTAPQCGGVLDHKPGPVDFPEVRDAVTRYSALLAGYPANGTVTVEGSVLVLTGTEPLNVVEIGSDDLLAAERIQIGAPLTSSFIVNVTGTSGGFSGGEGTLLPDDHVCGSGAVVLDDFCNQLVWNFPDATTVSVGGTAVQGSILAPHATLVASASGQVNGTVIVANFEIGACIELHPHYFNGCLCADGFDSPYSCCP